jgi:hypothetical protein
LGPARIGQSQPRFAPVSENFIPWLSAHEAPDSNGWLPDQRQRGLSSTSPRMQPASPGIRAHRTALGCIAQWPASIEV